MNRWHLSQSMKAFQTIYSGKHQIQQDKVWVEFLNLFKKGFSCYVSLKEMALFTDLLIDQVSDAGIVFDSHNDHPFDDCGIKEPEILYFSSPCRMRPS